MMMLLLGVLSREIVVEVGGGAFQVWQLRRGSGNPIEVVLNSESGRKTAAVASFDGKRLLVGERASAAARRNPGPVFTYFTHFPEKRLLDFANDPEAPELKEIENQKAVVLIQAIFEHIAKNMLGGQKSESANNNIQFTLIHPPQWSFSQLHAIQKVISQVNGAELALTVSTPEAVVVSYLGQRIREVTKNSPKEFIVVDVGSTTTSASVVRVNIITPDQTLENDSNKSNLTRPLKKAKAPEVTVELINTTTINVGGRNLTQCLVDQALTQMPNIKQNDQKIQQKIFEAVEKAKIKLSGSQTAKVHIESSNFDNSDAYATLKKENVDECINELYLPSLLNHLTDIEASTIETHSDIVHLFYGGGARVASLQKLLEKSFETPFLKSVNMDEGASYGGGLLTAKNTPGFRMAAHFITHSHLRPKLIFNTTNLHISHLDGEETSGYTKYDHKKSKSSENDHTQKSNSIETWEQLYLLNPLERHNMTIKVATEWLQKLKLVNHTFQVIHVSTQTKNDNSSEDQNNKKQNQVYNTESIEYQQIDIEGGHFGTLQFAAVNSTAPSSQDTKQSSLSRADLLINCMIDIEPIDTKAFTRKYEMKGRDNQGGMALGFGIIRTSKLKDLQADVASSSTKIQELYEKIQKLGQSKMWSREKSEARIEIILQGDGIGIPTVQAILGLYTNNRKNDKLTDVIPLRVQCFSNDDNDSQNGTEINKQDQQRVTKEDLDAAKRLIELSNEVHKQQSQLERLHNVLDATFMKAKLQINRQKELLAQKGQTTDGEQKEDTQEQNITATLNISEISSFNAQIADVDAFLQSFEKESKCSDKECISSLLERLEQLIKNIKTPLDLIQQREVEAIQRPKAIKAFTSALEQIQNAQSDALKLIQIQEQNSTELNASEIYHSSSKLGKILDVCTMLKNLQANGMERFAVVNSENGTSNKSENQARQKDKKQKKRASSGGIDNMFFKELLDLHYETLQNEKAKKNGADDEDNTQNQHNYNSTELALFASRSLKKNVLNALKECSSLNGSVAMIKKQLQQINETDRNYIDELQQFQTRIQTDKNIPFAEINQKTQNVLKISNRLERRVGDLKFESSKSRLENFAQEVESRLLEKRASGVAIYAIKKLIEGSNATSEVKQGGNMNNATVGRAILQILNQSSEHTSVKPLKKQIEVLNITEKKNAKSQVLKKQSQSNNNQFNNDTLNEIFMEKLLNDTNLTQQIIEMRLDQYEETLDQIVDIYNNIIKAINETTIEDDDLGDIDKETTNTSKDEL